MSGMQGYIGIGGPRSRRDTPKPVDRIAAMSANHYRESAEFQREQAEGLADALQQVIDVVGFEPGPPYDMPLFKSIYSVPRLLDHIRSMKP